MTTTTEALATVTEAEQLLFREARLLDSRRYEEWLELFTEDGLYWIPVRYDDAEGSAGDGAHDLRTDIHIIYDDATRRSERVWRTLHTPVLDQKPPSRTIHVVSNVEVEAEPLANGCTRVFCCQMISEIRPGARGQMGLNEARQLAARTEYHLRKADGRWLIALKKVRLLQADQPMYGLTFLV